MTIDNWLQNSTAALKSSGSESARLDCILLLEDQLQLDRSYILAHPEAELSPENQTTLAGKLARRLSHEPMAYIRGFAEFYGRRFQVSSSVLVPRPESETMITLLKSATPSDARIVDVGTGSGCLAITAALETAAVVAAVDIDEACLAVAGHNAVVHTASVDLIQGSLLEPFLPGGAATAFAPNVLLANLPYVPTDYEINDAAKHEPTLALFAGSDGLDLYRAMFQQAKLMAQPPTMVLTESLTEQHSALAAIAQSAGYSEQVHEDLIQVFIRQ